MSDSTDTTEHSSLPNDSDAASEHTDLSAESADTAAESAGGAADAGDTGGQRPSRTELLEEEGDIAADYLEELLDIADLDGDIDIDVADGRAQLAVVNEEGGDGLRVLVGRDGQVLTALQELTRLTVQAQTGQRSWLMLDIDGYRDQRKNELRRVAQEAVESVQSDQESVALRPMNSFERKVVHDVVAKAGLRSESEGEGDRRHVIVHPA
ncbi:Jag family protein [Brevibacterium yomogidense]|uniref:Jag family protein n=1 Tax=Brevibacterium yomogidense TaxID=946573 RepID=UPI0018DF58B5|nr:R3H domain-containing nucleic acid-binding protein [Brevibacterium yomogidense]